MPNTVSRPANPSRRFIRLRDVPAYLGMDKNRFNAEVRPYLTQITIGKQGIAFDRLELDAFADYHKEVHGRPPARRAPWEESVGQGSANADDTGTSRKPSTDTEIYESTGQTDYRKAEEYYDRRILDIRQVVSQGERPKLAFREAVEKFLEEECPTRSLERAGFAFDRVLPFVGDLPIECVHEGSLGRYRDARREASVSAGTINKELGFVRRVLILASRKWRYPNGTRYLDEAPLIGQVKGSARKPYPLEWTEQRRLLAELPPHLERIALFDVNTGLRSAELCSLRWSWEIQVPELQSSVFLLPEEVTKNGEERIVVLNRIARSVIESQRGKHAEYVFTYKEKPIVRINRSTITPGARHEHEQECRMFEYTICVIHSAIACGLRA